MSAEPLRLEVVLERGRIEHGRTFSPAALDALGVQLSRWVARRALEHWERTEVPPTRAVLVVTLDLQ